MGIVVGMQSHAASRSRAASLAKSSKFTPASEARRKEAILDHQLAGIRSRCHHLLTEEGECPISEASISRLGQISMTDRNEAIFIPDTMGQSVPIVKAMVSRDNKVWIGHDVFMEKGDDPDRLAESLWREQFRSRLIEAQGNRKNEASQNGVRLVPAQEHSQSLNSELAGKFPRGN